jgi:hypothetical protein
MDSYKVSDNLNWANDRELLPILNGEKLYFSGYITKINHTVCLKNVPLF